jgi:hypothetical protein
MGQYIGLYHYMHIQWNLSNTKHQVTREMCQIVQVVGILNYFFKAFFKLTDIF